jgi:hypothetical protein
MNKLPQELVDRISSHLSRDELKNTLLLSHTFCYPAEKYSGVFERFWLCEGTTRRFIDFFSGHRLLYLNNVEFGISLPLPEDPEGRDKVDQLSKNDKSLTEQTMILFKTIKTVEERAGSQNIGKIRLAISSPL